MAVRYILSNDGNVGLVIDGQSYQVASTHPTARQLVGYLAGCAMNGDEPDEDIVKKLADIKGAVSDFSLGRITIDGNTVELDGKEIHNVVVTKLIDIMRKGQEFEYMVKFLDRLMDNPSSHCVDALLEWMERGQIPITPEGMCLGYKSVRPDYNDWYSNTVNYTPGTSPPVLRRNEVDDDKTKLCSFGYHVGTLEYARNFCASDGRKMVLCMFDPKDVVSVYHEATGDKIRVCDLKVICDWNDSSLLDEPCYIVSSDNIKEAPSMALSDMVRGWFDNDFQVEDEDTDDVEDLEYEVEEEEEEDEYDYNRDEDEDDDDSHIPYRHRW